MKYIILLRSYFIYFLGLHCMKIVQIRSFFWSVFGHFSHSIKFVKTLLGTTTSCSIVYVKYNARLFVIKNTDAVPENKSCYKAVTSSQKKYVLILFQIFLKKNWTKRCQKVKLNLGKLLIAGIVLASISVIG